MKVTCISSTGYRRIKSGLFGLIASCAILPSSAQLFIGSDANSLVIKSGESFSYEGLTLTPSVDFTLTNTTLSRTDSKTITPAPVANYVSRYFSFSNTTSAFSGTIRFSYAGVTLTPLSAGSLELNIRSSTSGWINVSGTDVSGSYVQASVGSATTLNILTLASNVAPLPVNWLKFSAVQKGNTAELIWVTGTEQNTKDFLVQHSTTGEWQTIGSVNAAGNSMEPIQYNFTHQSPKPGYNHYRLIQRDIDGTNTYSNIATVLMGENTATVSLYPNPAQNGQFILSIAEPLQAELFDALGRKVFSKSITQGVHELNVKDLKSGVYYLRAGAEVLPVIVP